MDEVFSAAHLDSHDALSLHEADVLHLLPHDGLGCHGNQVHTQGLGHEREGAGDSDVALDDLQLVILVAAAAEEEEEL